MPHGMSTCINMRTRWRRQRTLMPPTGRIDRGGYPGIQAALVSGQVAAGVPGVNLALADGDQAARIVAEFPSAAAGLTSAGVIPPLPIDL
jgi:hypothetical protein